MIATSVHGVEGEAAGMEEESIMRGSQATLAQRSPLKRHATPPLMVDG